MAENIEEHIDPKYGKLDPELIKLLKDYELSYFREDLPVPFAPGLDIYPVPVRFFEEFASCSTCLSLNKNEDPKGISMSNLDYLLSKVDLPGLDGQVWAYKIYKLFEIIFRLHPGYECTSCHHVLDYSSEEVTTFVQACQTFVEKLSKVDINQEIEGLPSEPQLKCPSCGNENFYHVIHITVDPATKKKQLSVRGHIITKQEFNKLRQIVLFQNFPDYVDDSWVDPELRKDRDEKMQIEQRLHDLHATVEEKVVCLSISTNYKFHEIFDMSIRKFTMALAKVDDLINYKLLKQAQYSGFSGLPKDFKIEHWIYKPNKDMYGDSYRSTDSIQAV